jgi:hypothetical protein
VHYETPGLGIWREVNGWMEDCDEEVVGGNTEGIDWMTQGSLPQISRIFVSFNHIYPPTINLSNTLPGSYFSFTSCSLFLLTSPYSSHGLCHPAA